MSTPVDMSTGGSRPPRHGKKQNKSIPIQVNQITQMPSGGTPHSFHGGPRVYDGSSEPTASSGTNRKDRKHSHANAQSTPNRHQTPNYPRAVSQSQMLSPDKAQATPVKAAAYAGPTFHSSPAPSALPIPKMFSKSVPDSNSNLLSAMVSEDSDVAQTDPEESYFPKTSTPEPKGREPSPLDFLFDAARQARSSGHTRSPSMRSGNLSPSEEGTPISRPTTMFPIELDGTSKEANGIGPAFATPYKDHINAYKSNTPPATASQGDLEEEERMAKTEALKKLLGHQTSPSPRSTSASPYPYVSHSPSPQRHQSGPSTPRNGIQISGSTPNQPYFSSPATTYNQSPFRDIPVPRPISSRLRQQVSPPSPDPRAFGDSFRDAPSSSRTPRAMDAKKMEDDLRRVLKLDH